MKKLSIIVPVYNEKGNITKILDELLKIILPYNITKEIIVVDDGSTDGTRELLDKFKNQVSIIYSNKNQGKGAALKKGFRKITGDYVLIQDADLEYDPKDYLKLIEPVIHGEAEVVFGSRVLGNNSVSLDKVYFYGGLFLTKIFNFLFGSHLTDMATCYKLFPARFIPDLLKLPNNDFVFDVVELTHYLVRANQVCEVPIYYQARPRQSGKKINLYHGLKCFIRMIQIRVK